MEQEILDGNKLIAEFMGMRLSVDNESPFTEYEWLPAPDHSNWVFEDAPPFDRSWNWLMPVIEKIADTPMADFIDEETEDGGYAYPVTFGMRNEIGEWLVRFRGHGLYEGSTLIEAAWQAVVDFIKFHNTQTKSHDQ